jgi:hypothetical protein
MSCGAFFISIANIETLADFHFSVKQYVRGVLFRLCGEDDNIFHVIGMVFSGMRNNVEIMKKRIKQ